jgi:hypothetical protein
MNGVRDDTSEGKKQRGEGRKQKAEGRRKETEGERNGVTRKAQK